MTLKYQTNPKLLLHREINLNLINLFGFSATCDQPGLTMVASSSHQERNREEDVW